MWAVLFLSRDEESHRVLKNHQVRNVQTIIETVQSTIEKFNMP